MYISSKNTSDFEGPMQNVCIFMSKMTACVSPKWLWVHLCSVFERTNEPQMTLSSPAHGFLEFSRCFWLPLWAQSDFERTCAVFLNAQVSPKQLWVHPCMVFSSFLECFCAPTSISSKNTCVFEGPMQNIHIFTSKTSPGDEKIV